MLEDVNVSHTKAIEAVDRGSKTLKEANETYHILAGTYNVQDFYIVFYIKSTNFYCRIPEQN